MTSAPVLCVDIGNDRTDLGLLADGEVLGHWRLTTSETRTADEWWVLVSGLLGDQRGLVGGAVVGSAVPAVLAEWRTMLEVHLADLPCVVVGPGVRTGIPVRTDNPREVGADRVADALAALTRYGAPVVVVHLGTATCLEVVTGEGTYVGGVIAPGVRTSLDALRLRAAQLREVELVRPDRVVGRNTVEALQSGVLYGAAAQVEGLVARVVAEQGLDPASTRVVATGHLAPLVVDDCACVTDHDPWLTLRGLELVHRRNSRAKSKG
ncbi:type III pantothenate kinase [Nocardioides sp. CFH 31398]|uniref:type III pantothenate kinase n=1 Tax=Nocardioides sp. CFH 31398 TaxID=2919579 RepID=UPI001F06E3E5|nr:type III pantothenate kinase [Nocardioides sp. CFH 31398]MCH1866130.1 type III pantothenate kinase [Nocardioides sp. CFH 31398]